MAMSSEGDRLLIGQIREGDPRAWENLIARYEGRLLAFVERRLHDRAASEDVVQETFIGFLNSLAHFDDRRELQTYLFTIASHKLTDYLRSAGPHPMAKVPAAPLHERPGPLATASSYARDRERRTLEQEALAEALGKVLAEWREQG